LVGRDTKDFENPYKNHNLFLQIFFFKLSLSIKIITNFKSYKIII
jgi:hypothetical protein